MVSLPTPLQKISHPLLEEKGVEVWIKRDDLIHDEIMGNKWRKLKYNLEEMEQQGKKALITMGGAYSNHIAATAVAAKHYDFQALAIIRGEELNKTSNHTLKRASENGMEFLFVDRQTFRQWRKEPDKLKKKYPDHYFLPEGGTNSHAIRGCHEIVSEIDIEFDVIATPIGTGGTLVGLLSGVETSQHVLGVSALKGSFIHEEMKMLIEKYEVKRSNYEVVDDFHFGGYGKITSELIDFINWFKEYFRIQLEPIYTGKSFFGVWNMIKTDKFEKNLKIILLHTGGLQGISGFDRKNKNII